MIIEDEINDLYEKWLLDKFPEVISNKDVLIDKSCEGYERDTFNEEVKKVL